VTSMSSHVADLVAFGLDQAWSRTADVPSHDGAVHRWHLLDRPATRHDAPVVLCLHGNPTWSFVWSRVLQELSPDFRVIAPDHLSMGFSDRVSSRVYRDRVADIADLLDALRIDSAVKHGYRYSERTPRSMADTTKCIFWNSFACHSI
jgi:pimeloyl-ACP methyl ester carboxylesterase